MEGVIIALVLVAILLVLLFVSGYVKAGPDEVIRISGLGKTKYLRGHAGFRIPFLQRKDKLHLKAFQVDVKTTESVPTAEFINIQVDAVANLKISDAADDIERAFECLLCISETDRISQVQQVLQGNLREIVGTVGIRELVNDRKGVAEKVRDNVVPDMKKLGIELINFNIQNFTDDNHVLENLGIDNISQISKSAAIARAMADKEVKIAQAEAAQAANDARVISETRIAEQNNALSLKQSELTLKADTAKANADAAYEIQKQKRQEEINVAEVNASIAQKARQVELGEREVELQEKQLAAAINKKADAEKYAAEQKAAAELFQRQRAAEAVKFELEQAAEAKKIQAEADRVKVEKEAEAKKLAAEAERFAAEQKALGIQAVGQAEAEAIEKKAEAMKKMGEASVLQLILDSNVLPEIVKASSEPIAAAYSKIGNITMYGDGNQTKLAAEITNNSSQVIQSVEKSLGIDLKAVLAGYLGGKLGSKVVVDNNSNDSSKKIEKAE